MFDNEYETELRVLTGDLVSLALRLEVLPKPLSLLVLTGWLIEEVGPDGTVEFETGNGGRVWDIPDDRLDPLLIPTEFDVGTDSVREMAVPLDGAVGLGDAVAFVKEKGADSSDDDVRCPVPEAEPLTTEDIISDVMVLEIDSVPVVVARLVIELEPDTPLDCPDGPLDETVGPKLPVEFDSGNGGVDITDWEADEIPEPVLDPAVYGVTVNGKDALEELTGIEEPLGRFVVPVEVMPDGSMVPLGIFVEFDMGNGADVPEA